MSSRVRGRSIAIVPCVTRSYLSIADALRLIRAEYYEIPGLHLTQRQVERLWGLDTNTAEALLGALIDVQFLRQTRTGAYVRATNTEQARIRPINYDRWLNERDER
jgi:hypothetical protein